MSVKKEPLMEEKKPTLSVLKGRFNILRLEKDSKVPSEVFESDFVSITQTSDELSVVFRESNVQSSIPSGIRAERGWSCLKVEGPLDFSLTGILAGISSALAEKRISIFTISTYDTDYILVKETDLERTSEALANEGYKIRSP